MFNKKQNNFINISFGIITAVLVFYVLAAGRDFIIPFVVALLLSFAIIGLSNFYRGFKLPGFISFPLSIVTYGFLFWLIGKIIETNYYDFVRLAPEYFETISGIVQSSGDRFFTFFDIEKPESFRQLLQGVKISDVFNRISSGVLEVSGQLGIIIFYTLFILLEYRYVRTKLDLMFPDGMAKKKVFNVLDQIQGDVKSYFVIKAMVSFFVGLFSYAIMMIFGLEFAIFFAFIIFLLNFIPNIGSIIAVLFPVLFSLVQFESFYLTSVFMALMISVQVLMGNFVEPKFVGNKLNLSPLVIILSLVFWGKLWGVAGMFLSVPIMVIINIVLAAIPSTRPLAVLFSEKGVLRVTDDDGVTTTKQIVKDLKKKLRDTKKQLKK